MTESVPGSQPVQLRPPPALPGLPVQVLPKGQHRLPMQVKTVHGINALLQVERATRGTAGKVRPGWPHPPAPALLPGWPRARERRSP